MTKKQLLRCITFLLVCCVMILALCELFDQGNYEANERRYRTYRALEENTVDALYVGTSGVDRYWIGAKSYEMYGMTVYPVTFPSCPVWLIPDILEDAMRYQDPQLIVMDIRPFTQDCDSITILRVRGSRVVDSMEFFSPVRFRAACRTAELISQTDETKSKWDISFHLPFVMRHSMWEQDYLLQVNVGKHMDPFLGYSTNRWTSVCAEEQAYQEYVRDVFEPLDPVAEQYLYETLDYIREHDLDVVFVDSPKNHLDSEMARTNTVRRILEEEGIPSLIFSSEEDNEGYTINLDLKKDFFDRNHVNYYGAEKFTDALAAYLNDHFDLPDRRNDAAAQKNWDGVYNTLTDAVQEYEQTILDVPPEELAAELELERGAESDDAE